ncbi:hydroxyacid dehydrogenase [Flavobacterium aurantiibacter]|uniref:Hydroxyacid dehydrogenase n=1 Tax=Flavobacterium aurantiibacter TaxID=2023067 RepID=A0A255ZRJ0_9FLAO|nr:hydroxyacid dehydrogenase [Flavobacterium aurantiibacter]
MLKRIVHIDKNHPSLVTGLSALGFENVLLNELPRSEVQKQLHTYDGIVIRSRFPLDATFLESGTNLKFICRIGAGLENIDLKYCKEKRIEVIATPEGNANAVGEHTLGLLLNLMNKIKKADKEVCAGLWQREANRGYEIDGKTVGIIGYGVMGSAFARKLAGFDCEVLFYDIVTKEAEYNHKQVDITDLYQKADVISLHVPQTPLTHYLANKKFFDSFKKPIWLLNVARGSVLEINALVNALEDGKVLGAGLDVLEYESTSFQASFDLESNPDLQYLTTATNVILTPHIAGWSFESEVKMAQIAISKINDFYTHGRH